jgi:hypothetical protein
MTTQDACLTSPSPAPAATAADPVHSRRSHPDAGGGWFAIKEGFGHLKLPIREVQMPNRRVALPFGPLPAFSQVNSAAPGFAQESTRPFGTVRTSEINGRES